MKISELYKDEHVLVVNKPSGIPVIPERGSDPVKSMLGHLKTKYPEIRVVHRIDKDTSGAVIFALSQEVQSHLSRQFENRETEKFYLALVSGAVEKKEGEIDLPLKTLDNKNKVITSKEGKEAFTSYETAEKFRHYTLLRLKIMTGRTHQIRVHCKAMGHPLAVDPIYGSDEGVFLSGFKKNYKPGRKREEKALISRLSLHAHTIKFIHPVSGKSLEVVAPLPKDFKATLNQLRKWDS